MATEFINGQWRIPNSWNVDESNQGKISNYSMDFDPANTDYIDLGSEVLFDSTKGFSFSTWVKLEAYSPNAFPPICKIKTNQSTGFVIFISNNSTYYGVNIGSNSNFIRARTVGNISADFLGTWKHICVTFDGVNKAVSSSFKIYVDGSSVNLTTTGAFATVANENTLGFGSNAGITFNGKIDQTCVFDYELSSTQVSTLYGNNSAGYFQIGNPMAITPNPVAFYPLGDQDLIGAGYNGANYLVPNNSLQDYVFNFDGSNDYINFINGSTMARGQEITYSVWANLVTFSADIIGNKSSSNFGTGLNFAAGNLVFQLGNGSNDSWSNSRINLSSYVNTGEWFHIIGTFDGTNAKIYINGIERNNWTPTQPFTISGWNNNFQIGKRADQGSSFINGRLSNVAFWNSGLTPAQVTTIYNNGSPADISSLNPVSWWKLNAQDTFDGTNWTINDYAGSNDGTSSGMTSANLVQSNLQHTSGYSPYAIELNGTDQLFNCSNDSSLQITGAMTVSYWFKGKGGSATAGGVGKMGNSGSRGFLLAPTSIGTISFYIAPTASSLISANYSHTTDTNWHHIVGVFNPSTSLELYFDGQLVDTTPTSTSSQYNASNNLQIGARGDSIGFFDGQLSNVAIWNTNLSSSQISTMYNNGIPGDISSLNPLAWWELGSMMGFNGSDTYTALSNTDSNFAAVSTSNMASADVVNGPGYSNGGSGTSSLVIGKQAPYSFNNALSESMAISNRDDSQASDPYPLMTELDLTGETSSYTFTTPVLYTSGDISIDWGDGSAIQQTGTISNIRLTHVYDTDTYPRPLIQWGRSTDAGKISRFLVNGAGSRLNISNLKQWGKSFNGIQINFNNAANMIITAQDIPDFSSLTSMAAMFIRCNSITTIPNIEKWDVSNKAVNASQMFRFCQKFIATDLDNFADNVFTSQAAMFGNCTSLNSASFSKWRVRGAMSESFESMSSLDQDLSTKTVTRADGSTYIAWDISDCTSLFQMLDYSSGFTGTNPNISNWDTRNIVGAGFAYLFLQAKMNSDISTKQISTPNPYNTTYTAWDVNGGTNFLSFNQSNSTFNQNLRTWQLNESTTILSQIFTATGAFSDDNYTDTLVGWAVYLYGVENPPENLSLGNTSGLFFQGSRTVNSDDNGSTTTNYSSLYPSLFPATWTQASDARDYLVETLGWSSTGTPL